MANPSTRRRIIISAMVGAALLLLAFWTVVIVRAVKLVRSGFGSAALADDPVDETALQKFTPADSGPGIAVFDPVAASSGPDLPAFGAGCSAWLQYEIGGNLASGKSAMWVALDRARKEEHLGGLAVDLPIARATGRAVGADHVVVSALSGTQAAAVLTLSLHAVADGARVGDPLILKGSEEQIVADLPGAAASIERRLRIAGAAPEPVGLAPADLMLIGPLRLWSGPAPAADRARLATLSEKSGLAELVWLYEGGASDPAHLAGCAKRMLALGPKNAYAYSEIMSVGSYWDLPDGARVQAFAASHPANYLLADAAMRACEANSDRKGALDAAQRAAGDAPANPASWYALAVVTGEAANDIRSGRTASDLSESDWSKIQPLYDQWSAAALRATKLDPSFGDAWQELTEATTCSGHDSVARKAFEKALDLCRDTARAYGWGYQMFQPKWLGSMTEVQNIVDRAFDDKRLQIYDLANLNEELENSGDDMKAFHKAYCDRVIARAQSLLATDPRDRESMYAIAVCQAAEDDQIDARRTLETLTAQWPDAYNAWHLLGDIDYKMSLFGPATAAYETTVRLDPNWAHAHFDTGWAYKEARRYSDATREFKTEILLDPTDADGYQGLARTALAQNNYVLAELSARMMQRLHPWDVAAYEMLVEALDGNGKCQETIRYAAMGLNLQPGDLDIMGPLSDTYLQLHEWDKAIAECNDMLKINPNYALAVENIAEADIGMGRKTDAQANWRKVLTMGDDYTAGVARKFLAKYP